MSKESKYDLVIIGGGPAGLIAAGKAAEEGLKVLILERKERLGRKLLITGKGRCNITNTAPQSEFLKHIFPNPKFLKPAFSNFYNKDIVELLETHGCKTEEERGLRVFPKSNSAADVLNALLKWHSKYNIEVKLNTRVSKILTKENIAIGVEYKQQGNINSVFCKNVLVATGGKSYPATGSTGDGYELAKQLGHKITPAKPALVPLETEGNMAQRLQGLNLRNVRATAWVEGKKSGDAFGEMLFTHFGLSGPIILTLSREVVPALDQNKKVKISIDLKPALDEQKLDLRLQRDLQEHGKKKIDNILKGLIPSKMIPVFISELEIDPNKLGHQISAKERKKLRFMLKNLTFDIKAHRSFKEAIITSGGIELSEVNHKTMESKKIQNLYFAGEVLDLDAETGGYNLQIAYSTGWLAAFNVVKGVRQRAKG